MTDAPTPAPIVGEYRALFLDFPIPWIDQLFASWEASDTVDTICEGPGE